MYCLSSVCCVLLASAPDAASFRAKAAAWIEAETAEAVAGINVDRRKVKTALAGAVLGVHPDQEPDVVCRWTFPVERPVEAADVVLRYATTMQGRYRMALDGVVRGDVVFATTGGWGGKVNEFEWGAVRLGAELAAGEHRLELRATSQSRPINLDCLAIISRLEAVPVRLALDPVKTSRRVTLPEWDPPTGHEAVAFRVGRGGKTMRIWGGRTPASRSYIEEFLPGLFERTLVLDEVDLRNGSLAWIFTGDRGGFTISIEPAKVAVFQRFYDSFGLHPFERGKVRAARHPERRWCESSVNYAGKLRGVTVAHDYRLGLTVRLNGQAALHQTCEMDVSRHQLRLASDRAAASGRILSPPAEDVVVRIDPTKRHQTMMGFGGIATPTAYAQLSPAGKRRWWELVCEYNLLIQREYPIGSALNEPMDNWGHLADATPHYYGDNFPNGEVSDFEYIKTLRRLGGKVFFEFWALPPWACQDWKDDAGKVHKGVADPEIYTKAMINYCQASKQRAGAPPDVVGIQNEIHQPPRIWHEMTLALRRGLDEAGFKDVRIHMSDHGHLRGGIQRAREFKQSAEAWSKIDYAATHMYDYQSHFTDPDRYDEHLKTWNELTSDKPFLSTELCINKPLYQRSTYRLALTMGQLYHKNLTIADAVAVCYCWTLLNVVQPSYGWTRTLCVPDRANGFVPAASSHQLRVFGAYSRRVRAGMARVEAASTTPDVLAVAFVGEGDARTVVVLNRSTRPQRVVCQGVGAFKQVERVDPYHENALCAAPQLAARGASQIVVPPGSIVTLTTVALGRFPDGFDGSTR